MPTPHDYCWCACGRKFWLHRDLDQHITDLVKPNAPVGVRNAHTEIGHETPVEPTFGEDGANIATPAPTQGVLQTMAHNPRQPYVQQTAAWDLRAVLPDEFHVCPQTVNKVVVTQAAYRQMAAMSNAFTQEWLAYLSGHVLPDGTPVVTGLRVPAQQVTGASVDVDDVQALGAYVNGAWVGTPNHIGVMHSHHKMACTFSATDHQFVNANHPLSILLQITTDNKIALTCEFKHTVGCGIVMREKPQVVVETEVPDPTLIDFIAEAKTLVRPKSWTNPQNIRASQATGGPQWHGGGGVYQGNQQGSTAATQTQLPIAQAERVRHMRQEESSPEEEVWGDTYVGDYNGS